MKRRIHRGVGETAVAAEKPILLRKSLTAKILYWTFQGLTLGTMIASLVLFFVHEEQGKETTFNQVFMCIFALVALNLPLLLERKLKLYIPNYITIVLYCMIFFHFVLGEVYRAYDSVKIFDKVLHTTSGVIISLISFSIISILNSMQRTNIKLSPFFIVLFTFCFTMTSEYLWEIFEYLMDTLFGSNMQRWQDSLVLAEGVGIPPATAEGTFIINGPRGNGLLDTMGDMTVNIFGCLGVCIYAYIGMKLKPDWFTARVMLTKKDIDALEKEGAVVVDERLAENLSREEHKTDTDAQTKPASDEAQPQSPAAALDSPCDSDLHTEENSQN